MIAKRILKDPNLSQIATRKFNETIDREKAGRFVLDGALVTDLLDMDKDRAKEFEVEVMEHAKNEAKMLPGISMKLNSELPASEITPKNQFEKLKYSSIAPNSIKIRRKGGRQIVKSLKSGSA